MAKIISWLMLSRWSIGAYGSLVNINAMVPEAIKLPDGTIVTRLFEPTPVYDASWENLMFNWMILGLHALIYLAITFYWQKRKDIFN